MLFFELKLFIKESWKHTQKQFPQNSKLNLQHSANQHIRMISEGSCDTEDWSNDAENAAVISHQLIAFKNIYIRDGTVRGKKPNRTVLHTRFGTRGRTVDQLKSDNACVIWIVINNM